MLYVTGDVHGLVDFMKFGNPVLKTLGKEDFLIVCGDMGVVFNPKETEAMVNLYSYLPYTVLFCDGNHENFDELDAYPVEEWNGGKVHRLSPNLIHLMRGQMFDIDGKRTFTFGGARSRDRDYRVEGYDWWPQEEPSEEEFQEGLRTIEEKGSKVDLVITHECPTEVQRDVARLLNGSRGAAPLYRLNDMLQEFADRLEFKRWFFGHWHLDHEFGEYTCVYNDVHRVD